MRRALEGTGAESSTRWVHIASLRGAAFAGLHFYWAVGGDVGLSISAGPLATERPPAVRDRGATGLDAGPLEPHVG